MLFHKYFFLKQRKFQEENAPHRQGSTEAKTSLPELWRLHFHVIRKVKKSQNVNSKQKEKPQAEPDYFWPHYFLADEF